MSRKGGAIYTFDEWISIEVPEGWVCENDDEDAILNIYSLKNPKGVLQLSFYREDGSRSRSTIVEAFINRFIQQFSVQVYQETNMTIQRDDYTIGIAAGECDGRYLKVWCLTEGGRTLMATYNSEKKTREINVVDDIVFGIRFT